MAGEHRAQAAKIREFCERERGSGCWGLDLLPALARIHDQLADEADARELGGEDLVEVGDLQDDEVEVWADRAFAPFVDDGGESSSVVGVGSRAPALRRF